MPPTSNKKLLKTVEIGVNKFKVIQVTIQTRSGVPVNSTRRQL